MKQQFLKNTSDTFKTYIYENNRKIAPAEAHLTVYMPSSVSKLIDNAAMTVGADGLLSYNLGANDNSAAAVNYKASITYVHDSRSYYATLFYDVVNSRLTKVVTDEDVVNELPQLRESGWKVCGAAEGGSTTTIVDSELGRYEDDYFTGGLAYCIDKDETRDIADFNQSAGTVTASAFSSAVAAGEQYVLTRSFSREIQRAFEKIEDRLLRLGKRPHLVLDPYDLREVHIFQSVAEVCKGLATNNGNLWWEMWKEYERKAEDAFKSINFKYDSSEDGYVGAGEGSSVIDTVRSARR